MGALRSATPRAGELTRRGVPATARPLQNAEIADTLERVADLLEAQHAGVYRVRAWRAGAAAVRAQPEPLSRRIDRGGALEEIPCIGRSLAAAIRELAHTGRLRLLERLEAEVSPEALLSTVPGLGRVLAHRIHAELGIETLEDLELAVHDGRLRRIRGFGPRRVRGLAEVLDSMLARSTRRRARGLRPPAAAASAQPEVATLLAVDALYRQRAALGELPRIAPRRFNPRHEAWLPVLHTTHSGWSFQTLFSNTARAHDLGRTHDWVVLHYEREGDEGQCTVVTELRGPLAGRRVVRGREQECARYYAEWSGWWDSNPRRGSHKDPALATELHAGRGLE